MTLGPPLRKLAKGFHCLRQFLWAAVEAQRHQGVFCVQGEAGTGVGPHRIPGQGETGSEDLSVPSWELWRWTRKNPLKKMGMWHGGNSQTPEGH